MAKKRDKLKFIVIDDDDDALNLLSILIKAKGHSVVTYQSSNQALKEITRQKPDCVVSDLMLPGLGGIELFKEIRKIKSIKQPTFIIVTSKLFEFDRKRARSIGIDGYIHKPFNNETFMDELEAIVNPKMEVQFWGVRGTLSVSSKDSIYFGGNTNCVTLRISQQHFFIFDAGTGIKALSNHLREKSNVPISAKIFISHPHWDHINGLPFFEPLYGAGNEFQIYGADHEDLKIENIISNQMSSVYFPITMKELAAKISFHSISEEEFNIDDVKVRTILLNHPGHCLGYRIEHKNKSFCYITDTEIYPENYKHYSEFEFNRLVDFVQGTDLIVMDSTYTDEEYTKKMHWGHSSISRVVDLFVAAKVQTACLYHHDPGQIDSDIRAKLQFARKLIKERKAKVKCIAPREGDKILI